MLQSNGRLEVLLMSPRELPINCLSRLLRGSQLPSSCAKEQLRVITARKLSHDSRDFSAKKSTYHLS